MLALQANQPNRPSRTYVTALTILTVGVSALAWLLYGSPHAGYDASWALLWGRELIHGSLPSYKVAFAPTPHPLLNVVAAVVGSGGLGVLSLLAFGALTVALAELGRALFSVWVGVVAALLVFTQPLLIAEAEQAVVDVPFLALAVAAATLVARGSRGWTPGVVLAVAGLLRPEAWLLGLAWVLWRRPGVGGFALVCLPPLLWALSDLLVTGDPLHSLHGTRALGEELGRPRAADTALSALPVYLRAAVGPAALWAGLAGAVAGLLWLPERSLFAVAVAAVGVVAFLVLGLAGLPLLIRYLLLPAVVLMLFAGVCVAGWTVDGRVALRVCGVVGLVVLLAASPAAVRRVRGAVASTDQRRVIQDDLVELARSDAVQRAAAACDGVSVPDYRARPVVALALDVPPTTIGTDGGLAFVYASEAAARRFSIGLDTPVAQQPAGPVIAANGSWRVHGCIGG